MQVLGKQLAQVDLADAVVGGDGGIGQIGVCVVILDIARHALADAVAVSPAGTEAVDGWLKDPSYLTPQGVLTNLPDRDAASYLKKTKKSVALYGKLYYES